MVDSSTVVCPRLHCHCILEILYFREKSKRTNLKTGVSRKQSMPKFPENKHFLPPDTHTYVCVSGDKKCFFFGNFGVLCFLETPALRFALLPYYRRYDHLKFCTSCRCHKLSDDFECVFQYFFDQYVSCICTSLLNIRLPILL